MPPDLDVFSKTFDFLEVSPNVLKRSQMAFGTLLDCPKRSRTSVGPRTVNSPARRRRRNVPRRYFAFPLAFPVDLDFWAKIFDFFEVSPNGLKRSQMAFAPLLECSKGSRTSVEPLPVNSPARRRRRNASRRISRFSRDFRCHPT